MSFSRSANVISFFVFSDSSCTLRTSCWLLIVYSDSSHVDNLIFYLSYFACRVVSWVCKCFSNSTVDCSSASFLDESWVWSCDCRFDTFSRSLSRRTWYWEVVWDNLVLICYWIVLHVASKALSKYYCCLTTWSLSEIFWDLMLLMNICENLLMFSSLLSIRCSFDVISPFYFLNAAYLTFFSSNFVFKASISFVFCSICRE